MGSTVILLVIIACAGWIIWRRRRGQANPISATSPGVHRKNSAHKAFVHGNTCLVEGKFDEARLAFQQAHELEPRHPHVAGRLAEVERQQQAVSAIAPTNSTS